MRCRLLRCPPLRMHISRIAPYDAGYAPAHAAAFLKFSSRCYAIPLPRRVFSPDFSLRFTAERCRYAFLPLLFAHAWFVCCLAILRAAADQTRRRFAPAHAPGTAVISPFRFARTHRSAYAACRAFAVCRRAPFTGSSRLLVRVVRSRHSAFLRCDPLVASRGLLPRVCADAVQVFALLPLPVRLRAVLRCCCRTPQYAHLLSFCLRTHAGLTLVALAPPFFCVASTLCADGSIPRCSCCVLVAHSLLLPVLISFLPLRYARCRAQHLLQVLSFPAAVALFRFVFLRAYRLSPRLRSFAAGLRHSLVYQFRGLARFSFCWTFSVRGSHIASGL